MVYGLWIDECGFGFVVFDYFDGLVVVVFVFDDVGCLVVVVLEVVFVDGGVVGL